MFGNPSDKNTNPQNNNPSTGLFGNVTSNPQNKAPGSSLFGSSSGGLFGSINPSGGLFNPTTAPSGGLFGNPSNNTMKTTQRKQGGLFGNSSSVKPPSNDQAPKLMFPGMGITPAPNTPFSIGSAVNSEIKSQKEKSGSLFGNNTGSFFGNNNLTPSPTYFGNTPGITPKVYDKKPVISGGLFSGVSQDKKQISDTNTNKQKPTLSFGNTQGSLFGNTPAPTFGEKKQTGGLFGNSGPSLFSGANQSSSGFGATTKKQEDKREPQGLLSTNTPSTPLFGQKTPIQNTPQQKPAFSLTGGMTSTPTGLGGLFTKKQTDSKPVLASKPQIVQKQEKPEMKPSTNSLFNLSQPKDEGQKITPSPIVGSGGLFGTQKVENKPSEPSPGLFNNDKKQTTPSFTGGLFGQKLEQNKPKQTLGNSGLFGGNTSLFSQSIPRNQTKTEAKKVQNATVNQFISAPQQIKSNENLLAAFSKDKINDASTVNQTTQNAQKRTNRTISFNLNLNQPGQTSPSNRPTQIKPSVTGSLFGNNQSIPTNDTKPIQKDTLEISMTESIIKPSATGQPGSSTVPASNVSKSQKMMQQQFFNGQPGSSTVPASNVSKSQKMMQQSFFNGQPGSSTVPASNVSKSQKMMQQSFFKPAETVKKQAPPPTIWTAFEINNLLKEQISRKSSGPSARNGQRCQKNFTKNIEEWIEESFTRFNQVPTTEMLQKKFSLHSNEDINRFLNNIVMQVVLVTNLPLEEKSFKLINKLFFQLLDKLGIKQYLFNCTKVDIPEGQAKNLPSTLQIVQLNSNYFTIHQIYQITAQGLQLNLDSEEFKKYVLTLTKKFIANQLEYLEYIQNKTDLLKLPSRLFYHLLTYCLKYKKIRLAQSNVWKDKNPELVALVQDFEKKIITKIITLLSGFVESTFYDFLLINKQHLPEFIEMVQNFSYTEEEEIIHLSLKVILNNLGIGTSNVSGKQELQLTSQLINLIKQTKSLQLLPFRTLAAIHQNKGYRTFPSAHDLYRYINGPEWLEWLQIYLGNNSGQKQISVHEAKYIIKILKYPVASTKRISREKLSPKQARYMQSIESKVLNRKKPIYKYIISLKEQNLLNIFYEILMSIIYDYESYRKIEELFFRQKDQFNYEFRNVIAQICNYPTQNFRQQIPFLQEKVLYFLRIVEVAPERTLALQKLVFEGTPQAQRKPTKDDSIDLRDYSDLSEVGHKICHLIIDTINYFGLKNNQKIVAKCISAVKSLLDSEQTSISMKIAMAVNKPQMLFISSSLLAPNQYRLIQSLVVEMTELLEFMLISQEFSQTLALSLYTNNSEDVHLERMYSVRYSSKDYLPFVRELIINNFENKNLSGNQTDHTKVTITYSSYWILKCLQVLVQDFRQEKTTASSHGKNLLYMLSLILEKLFIPISHEVQYQDMSTKMMQETIERVNNPIYSSSSSNEIPKVLLYLAQALNTIDIMSILSENLKYKLLNTGQVFESKSMVRSVKYCLANEKLQDDYEENQFTVYLSVKILKQILQVYRVYEQFKHAPLKVSSKSSLESAQNHFVYKLLTRFKWIQDIEFNLFLKGFSKTDLLEEENNSTTNLIIGLITLLMSDTRNQEKSNSFIDQIFESTPLNLKEHNYRKPFVVPIESSGTLSKKSSSQLSSFTQVQNFYTKFGQTLNFQAINNFLVNPTNIYLESYESLECLVVQSLGLMISGETLFGTRACNTVSESSINIAKFIGFYSNLDLSSEAFSNMWILESFESQLFAFLSSRNTSLHLKQAVLEFLYQVIKNEKSSNNFIIAKRVFYKYLIKHLDKFSHYSEEEINRLNTIVIRILNLLEERDYFIMRKQCNDRLLDALIGLMLKSCQKCLKSTGNLVKLIKSFNSKIYYPAEFAYYHLQRTYEERQIIKTGQAYEILKGIIELIEKRFFDVGSSQGEGVQNGHRWKCIKKINSLIIALNLPYVAATINDSKLSQLSIRHIHQEETNRYYFNTNLPHSFGQNPYELYLTQAKTLSYIEVSFDAYKQNVVDWLSFASMRLGSRILKFLNWVLTVDKSLYGNQPIIVKSRQLQACKQQTIICSMHMGSYKHTAIQIFAETENQAINLVKTLFDQSLRNLEKGMTVNQTKCFSIMGYCLEWIRARENTQDILQHLVRNTIRNQFWIDQNTIKNHSVIKFILSLVSIGSKTLESSEFRNLRGPILEMIYKFKEGKSQLEESLIQQLVSILISIPPQAEETMAINQIVSMWRTETNNEYFYNQSRLLLELSQKYPNEIAKLKALRSCQKAKKAVSTSHYSYNLRFPDSISFVWALKIASTLMSTEMETVLIFEEISEFYNMKNDQIYNLLLKNTSTLSFVHIEELQALLEFILTLITSQSWVTVHRKQFEKLTYVLSHKLINLFMDFINSKITFVAESDMEKRFKKIRYESYVDQLKEQTENQFFESSIEKNSVFRMLAQLKMMECIKTFTIVLSRCFEQSWYVHKYFNEEVYENYRYGVSFWDRMNKCIMDLIRFNINVEKKWRKSQNPNQKLLLIQDCINSSEFFVETGYLSSLYSIPLNNKQLFEEFEELNRVSLELGTVHLIQEKTFRQKYQCLMKGNIQKFGKKLLENSKIIQAQSEQQEMKMDKSTKTRGTLYIESWQKNLTNLIKTL